MESQPRKLLDQVRDVIRMKHYSYRTEKSYVAWICRFIIFYNKRVLNVKGIDVSRQRLGE
ncbi:phage integrase N-terminal SAM-like domain-containing protein [Trichocoleus desertorum]|uniref:phage integrase N-terminal SAM-like domain-containing protein n=1 Tax=Trichocoleus desertorum TaxID=1481672 RepID=UPI003D65CDDC